MFKRCNRCGDEKSLDSFHRSSTGKLGRAVMCKPCKADWAKDYARKNGEKIREYALKWQAENPDKVKAYADKGRDRKISRSRDRAKEVYYSDPDAARKKLKDYRSKNAEKVKAWNKEGNKRRYRNPKFRAENAIRNGIWCHISRGKKKGLKTFEILGYTPEELCAHLDRQFAEGMTWDNYGAWHIDHIIPLSAFNYSDVTHIDFERAWRLDNLRPLWAFDNMSKGDKLECEFQPSLQI